MGKIVTAMACDPQKLESSLMQRPSLASTRGAIRPALLGSENVPWRKAMTVAAHRRR